MEGLLYEIEMAYDGKGKSRGWWESSVLEQPLGKKVEDEEEESVAEDPGFHGWLNRRRERNLQLWFI